MRINEIKEHTLFPTRTPTGNPAGQGGCQDEVRVWKGPQANILWIVLVIYLNQTRFNRNQTEKQSPAILIA